MGVSPSAGIVLGAATVIFTAENPWGQVHLPVMRFGERQLPLAAVAAEMLASSCCQAPPNAAELALKPNGRHNPIAAGRSGGCASGGCVRYAQSDIVANGWMSSKPAGHEHEPVTAFAPSSGHQGHSPKGGAASGDVLVRKPPPAPLLAMGSEMSLSSSGTSVVIASVAQWGC
jgi:hypothetical protein